jgi:enoyl-CoA hydratase/carnithine racemase
MTTPTVLVEHRSPLTIVSLNRPERRNAVDRDTVAGAGRFAGGAGRHGTFRD